MWIPVLVSGPMGMVEHLALPPLLDAGPVIGHEPIIVLIIMDHGPSYPSLRSHVSAERGYRNEKYDY